MTRLYPYVGPADIKARVAGRPAGTPIKLVAAFLDWLRDTGQRPGSDDLVTVTFVIDANGDLLVADRRSEHVACAGGGPVLSAGELSFRVTGKNVAVEEASNQSTGFCPEPGSWPAVAAALERAGITHPDRFTIAIVFRRCEKCGERNVVKDQWFVCGACGAALPEAWNF